MAKQVNDQLITTKVKNADKEQKQKNRAERDKKRAAAVAAKCKARDEAKEKGLPWNDSIPAARFLDDYDSAFMSAIAGEVKVSEPIDPNIVCGVNQDPEADQVPVQTEKTSAQLTLEAAKKHKEELAAAALKAEETANDNAEEPEAPTCTGVDVVAKEAPESDTPAQDAPVEETSDVIPSIDLNDPSTWPLEANGGLMRLPGEPGKKFSSRKHKLKLWKREQEKLIETRNGDAPAEEVSQSLPKPIKSAAESANVFEAAAMGQTDEFANETPTEEPAEQTQPAERTEDKPEPVVENPENTDAGTPAVTECETQPDPVIEATTTKPTLTLASSQTDDEALTARAQKFYGDTWTAEQAEKLTKAFKFLEMAIRLETEALGISVTVAKAA